VLLNFVILALSLYWMSLYKLPVKVRTRIDQFRKRFL
jgi:hypothetical protein